jgi:hypothetical protein
MKPTIGRIVHFVSSGDDAQHPSAHFAAVITHVWSDVCVNLAVFPKGTPLDGLHSGVKTSVMFNEQPAPYSWHWPERD